MRETASLSSLVTDLKFYGNIQTSEGLADPADIQKLVVRAVSKHNGSYLISTTASTVPKTEDWAITLLAWSLLCIWRANKFADDPSTNTGMGFSTDRDTPFQKTLTMAKRLEEQYVEECQRLGLSVYAGRGGAQVSSVVCENLDSSIQVPVEISLAPPPISLSSYPAAALNADGSIELMWSQPSFSNFYQYYICRRVGSDVLYQEWNFSSASTVPRINDDAGVAAVTDMDAKSVKLTGLETTPGTVHRFIIVCRSKSDKYSYSNELVITQA